MSDRRRAVGDRYPIIPENVPKSLRNFRQLWPTADDAGSQENINTSVKVFRSSRPDLLSKDEADALPALNIKSIIDGRAANEYIRCEGDKYIDKYYELNKVNFRFLRWTYEADERVDYTPVPSEISRTIDKRGRHFFIDFFRLNYIFSIFFRGPIYIQVYSLFLVMVDLVKRTGYFPNFIGIFARNVLNPMGLIGQYKDIVTHSQTSIAAALKLLTDPQNLPAMINCSHGKDRTGILSALVLSIMGKSREYIIWDYALTQEGLKPVMDRVHKEICERYSMADEFQYAKPKIMEQLLDFIDVTYGSVPKYLDRIGFGYDEQRKLRDNLMGTKM